MSKIICDICGTTYPETAERCPICGCTKEMVDHFLADEKQEQVPVMAAGAGVQGGQFFDESIRRSNQYVPKEDYDEDDEEDFDEYPYEDERPKSNTFLVVLLVILIVALLAVTGFIFVKYFLPGVEDEATEPVATQTGKTTDPTSTDSTEPTIPCESLVLTSGGTVELNEAGQNWLLNVSASPADTTDTITYLSSNQAVAVVNESGRVTAVGEGETVITICCGTQKIECVIICNFSQETEPSDPTEPSNPTEPSEPEGTDPTEPVEGTKPTEPAEPTNPVEPTKPTEPVEPTEPETPTEPAKPTEPTKPQKPSGDIVLTLNKTDLTFGRAGIYYQLDVTEGLDPKQVTWITTNSSVANVWNGLITTMGPGTCVIIAKYQGQEVRCVVRCVF